MDYNPGDRVRTKHGGMLGTVTAVVTDTRVRVAFGDGMTATTAVFLTAELEPATGAPIGSAPFGFQDADRGGPTPESPGGGDASGAAGPGDASSGGDAAGTAA